MTKEHSIALHLAKVMRLEGAHLHTYPSVRDGEVLQDVFIAEEIGKKRFYPFTNRAQWADVVLWYVHSEAAIRLGYLSTRCPATGTEIGCSNNNESRMAATLEAIALATGWAQ